jgi:hypothetical protein
MSKQYSCFYCSTSLVPQNEPDYFTPFAGCKDCRELYCLRCISIDQYTKNATVVKNCTICDEDKPLKIFLNVRERVKKCERCTAWFDEQNPRGCKKHTGQHEMPLDSDGQPVYGYATWLDYGNGETMVLPYYYPGRYTCCGHICKHTLPMCEDVSNSGLPAQPIKIDYAEVGCVPADHTTEKQENSRGAIGGSFYTKETNDDWKDFAAWNIGKPETYPCGESCPFEVKDKFAWMPVQLE